MITIDVRAAGSNPTKKEIEVVNAEEASGNAEFKLAGGKVDIGAHEYGLTHGEDANWYLETEGELTKTAKSVETMPALHLSIVNAGMNELRKRLGDLRSGNPDAPAGVARVHIVGDQNQHRRLTSIKTADSRPSRRAGTARAAGFVHTVPDPTVSFPRETDA